MQSPGSELVFLVPDRGATPVKPYEREALLDRIDRDGATIGVSVPESVTVDGEELRLRELVFDLRDDGAAPEGNRPSRAELKRALRGERRNRRNRLEEAAIDRQEAEAIVASIAGIDRALELLDGTETDDIESTIEAAEQADQQRWLSFLKQALGHKDDQQGGSGRFR